MSEKLSCYPDRMVVENEIVIRYGPAYNLGANREISYENRIAQGIVYFSLWP